MLVNPKAKGAALAQLESLQVANTKQAGKINTATDLQLPRLLQAMREQIYF